MPSQSAMWAGLVALAFLAGCASPAPSEPVSPSDALPPWHDEQTASFELIGAASAEVSLPQEADARVMLILQVDRAAVSWLHIEGPGACADETPIQGDAGVAALPSPVSFLFDCGTVAAGTTSAVVSAQGVAVGTITLQATGPI